MTRNRSDRARVSIYKLSAKNVDDVQVKPKYFDQHDFIDKKVQVDNIEGRLLLGHIQKPRARWADNLEEILGEAINVSNNTAAALLLIPVDKVVYALTFGMGHFLVDYDKVTPGFGMQYAARVLDPEAIKTITRHTMDSRAQIERRSIPSGAGILAFGLMDLGAVVSKVIGRARSESGKAISVRGADALSIPVGRAPAQLLDDLRQVTVILDRKIADPELRVLTRMSPLQPKDPRRDDLNQRLNKALHGHNTGQLGTAWPWEQADEFTVVESVRFKAPRQEPQYLPWLTIEDLQEAVRHSGTEDAVGLLRKAKVLLFSDEDCQEVASPEVAAIKWVAYETHHDNMLFFFHDGRWLSMEQRYSEEIREQTSRILNRPSTIELRPWRWSNNKATRWDEETYNKKVVEKDRRFLVMDQKLIRPDAHQRGIEACDLLGPNGELVHVKRLRRSGDASHLFAQALVSAESLIIDPDAKTQFDKKVKALSNGKREAPERIQTVVLAIAGRHPLSTKHLFTFSQITMARLVENLRARSVDVQIISIPDERAGET